jgi:hypothetical protein
MHASTLRLQDSQHADADFYQTSVFSEHSALLADIKSASPTSAACSSEPRPVFDGSLRAGKLGY